MGARIDGKDSKPGGYDNDYLVIRGKYGEVDITAMFEQIEIIEDINAMCITGSIVIVDGLNIISNLPIVEGDILAGSFSILSTDPYASEFDPDYGIEFEYEIVKILDRSRIKQDIQAIRLSFVSSSWTDNLANRVSKAWCQTPYSDAAKEIFEDYLMGGGLQKQLPQKPIESETSDEMFNFIIPNWKPYEAINWLLARAWIGPAANFLCFEDKEKFNIITANTLVAKDSVLNYFTDTQGQMLNDKGTRIDEDALESRYHNLYDLHIYDSQDITGAGMGHFFGRRLITHDIVKKKVVDYYIKGSEAGNYKLDAPREYNDDYGELDHINDGDPLVEPDVSAMMGMDPGNAKLAVFPIHFEQWPSMPEFKPEKWLRQRRAQIEQLNHVMMEASAPGNFTLKAGDIIDIDMISPQWKSKGTDGGPVPEKDKRFNGRWMISSINRVIKQDDHSIVLKLVQDTRNINPDHIWSPEPEREKH